jgi:superfamily I DNA/RNA helicase/RecB family exonuclease
MNQFILGGPLTGKTQRLVQKYLDAPPATGVLCLSFFETNVEDIQNRIERVTGTSPPWVITMQRFIFWLLREYETEADLSGNTEVISALARSLIIRQAWHTVGGVLWKRYRETPGGTEEISRAINWLSTNRKCFTIQNGEMGDHDLAQVYTAYVDICNKHQILTFQESGLRALQLLSNEQISSDLCRRFPIIMVDDLHQARPDQLAWIEALCSRDVTLVATAWLGVHSYDPGLAQVRKTIERIEGSTEYLTESAQGVNPCIYQLISRLDSPSGATVQGLPISLLTSETVEDETRAVAHAIIQTLQTDRTIGPGDMLIICMDTVQIRFMQRHLERANVRATGAVSSTRLNPFIRAGTLIAQWYARGPRYTVLNRLLHLPLFTIDPLDLGALEAQAKTNSQSILEISEVDYPDTLRHPEETASMMTRIRQALAYRGQGISFADLITQAIESLDDGRSIKTISLFDAEQWREGFTDWIKQIQSLEAMAAKLHMRSREVLPLIERLVDQIEDPLLPDCVYLTDGQGVEGIRRRIVYLMGVSENVIPRLESPLKIVEEADLAALFTDQRPVVLPAHRDQEAWIERETRRLAVLMSRASEQLTLSISRYTATGDAQLPSPFFDPLLGKEGEIDQSGRISISSPSCWTSVEAPRAEVGGILHEKTMPVSAYDEPYGPEHVVKSPIYSASQIRTYLRCPLQFFYDRVLHLDSDESPGAMKRGALLHLILCVVLGDGSPSEIDLRSKPRSPWLDDVDLLTQRGLAALEAAWKGESTDLPGGGRFVGEEPWADQFGPALQRDAVGLWAREVLSRWADFEVNGRPDRAQRRPILLEMPFRYSIDEYLMIGRIDRIDEVRIDGKVVYDVIDYKTGAAGAVSLSAQINKFLPQKAGGQATDYQLPIYALALQQGIGGLAVIPQYLTYINLDRLEKTAREKFKMEASRSVQLLDGDMVDTRMGVVPASFLDEEIYDGIRTTLQAMSSSPYPAVTGFHCKFCGFQTACSRGLTYIGNE